MTLRTRTYAQLITALGRQSIVLVGMMGAGKSAVGRRLAQRIGLEFFDTDSEIVRQCGMPIADYFKKYGEADFRQGERRVIGSLLTKGPLLISTGGGAFCDPATQQAIRAGGITIWLKEDPKILWDRLRERTDRPLLLAPNPEDAFYQIYADRESQYAKADVTIELHNRHRDKIAEEILGATSKLTSILSAKGAVLRTKAVYGNDRHPHGRRRRRLRSQSD